MTVQLYDYEAVQVGVRVYLLDVNSFLFEPELCRIAKTRYSQVFMLTMCPV